MGRCVHRGQVALLAGAWLPCWLCEPKAVGLLNQLCHSQAFRPSVHEHLQNRLQHLYGLHSGGSWPKVGMARRASVNGVYCHQIASQAHLIEYCLEAASPEGGHSGLQHRPVSAVGSSCVHGPFHARCIFLIAELGMDALRGACWL